MDIQSLFYLVGSITMIVFLIAIVIFVYLMLLISLKLGRVSREMRERAREVNSVFILIKRVANKVPFRILVPVAMLALPLLRKFFARDKA